MSWMTTTGATNSFPRTFKSEVLQYLYFGTSRGNLHSALGFFFDSEPIRMVLAKLFKKRWSGVTEVFETEGADDPKDFEALLNLELKKVTESQPAKFDSHCLRMP